MPGLSNSVSNQSPRVTANYLNDVNDPAPGVPLTSPSGSIVQSYAGQVGGKLFLGSVSALALSDTAIGTLYGGVYQYVKTIAASTAAPTRGNLCFWSDRENFVVTPDVTATTISWVAGVYINALTKGQYGFIQIAGKASVKFAAAVTKVTPAIGDLVLVDATPTFAADVILDATALTSPLAKTIIGVAIVAPVQGTITTVSLNLPMGGFTY